MKNKKHKYGKYVRKYFNDLWSEIQSLENDSHRKMLSASFHDLQKLESYIIKALALAREKADEESRITVNTGLYRDPKTGVLIKIEDVKKQK